MMMQKTQKGFTLIELMIVVAIIGILASVALPAYQNYTTRSKLSEMVVSMSAVKTDLYEAYTSDGSMPLGTSGLITDITASLDDKNTMNTATYTRNSDTSAQYAVTLENVSSGVNGEIVNWTFESRQSGGGTELGLTVTCAVAVQASWTNAQLPPLCRF